MKVAIFGGTFNPIHIGHLIMGQYVLNFADIDKILFIPNGKPPHKNNIDLASEFDRYNMVELAIKNNKNYDISDYEIKKGEYSYTIDTLLFFKKIYDDVSFIIGSDNLDEIILWRRSNQILSQFPIIVLPRTTDRSEIELKINRLVKNYNSKIKLIDMPVVNISSTEVRRLIKEKKSIKYLVPENVEEYIKRKGLYLE